MEFAVDDGVLRCCLNLVCYFVLLSRLGFGMVMFKMGR